MQCKFACGCTPSLEGECAECRQKRLSKRRHSTSQAEPTVVPLIVHEVLRSPGRPHWLHLAKDETPGEHVMHSLKELLPHRNASFWWVVLIEAHNNFAALPHSGEPGVGSTSLGYIPIVRDLYEDVADVEKVS